MIHRVTYFVQSLIRSTKMFRCRH